MTEHDYSFTETDIQAIVQSLVETDCDEDAQKIEELWWQYHHDLSFMKDKNVAVQRFLDALRDIIQPYEEPPMCFGLGDRLDEPHKICVLIRSCTCDPTGPGFDELGNPVEEKQ